MDQVFAVATTDRFTGLLLDRVQLAKPNTYYHSIHPVEATAVDARLAEEKRIAEEKAKAAAAAKAAAPVKPATATAQSAAAPSAPAPKPPPAA
jgi:NADH-quinone oxidoreductase subunit I